MKQTQNKTQTPSSAAAILGVTPQYVRQLAHEHGLGEKVVPNRILLYPQDMAMLRAYLSSVTTRRPRISNDR